MTHDEMRVAISRAWSDATHPLTADRALEIAKETLKGHPREISQFSDWFKDFGQAAVTRFNGGRV